MRPKRVYYALLVLRVCIALWGFGYIHPDEHFQNGEVTAGWVFGIYTLRTWEWVAAFPCRAILPPTLTTGLPYLILKAVSGALVTPLSVFRIERLSFICVSLILDYSVVRLVSDSSNRAIALVLLASSHVVHTFQIRPFSNSIEAALISLSMVILRSLISSDSRRKRNQASLKLTCLAFLGVSAVFTRLTAVSFMGAIAWQTLAWSIGRASSSNNSAYTSLLAWFRLMLPPLSTAILTMAGFILIDTIYFRGDLSSVVVTPLNFWSYNSKSSNLAEHGHHPRWLHVLVNLPLIVGPGLLYYGVLAAFDALFRSSRTSEHGQEGIMNKTYIGVIVTSLTILSFLPHQEPRFLTPLLLPVIVLAAQSGRLLRAGSLFWVSWILANVSLVVLFGVLHQGGVVPSLFRLHDMIMSSNMPPDATIRITYWKTYMPPWRLLAIQEQDVLSGKFILADLGGASTDVLLQVLLNSAPSMRTYLVAPFHSFHGIIAQYPGCFTLQETVTPHLDLDHIPQMMEVGWKDGLSLGIFTVDTVCLRLR